MYYVKRDGGGKLIEVKVPGTFDPATVGEYEILDGTDPEIQRFHDPTFSYRAWLKDRAKKDPALRVMVLWISNIAGKTPAQALSELEAICESILPDV